MQNINLCWKSTEYFYPRNSADIYLEGHYSILRDTDMAEEMTNFSKNNILMQAGQSMLAQANQSNQGVLSLLG